MKRLSLSIIAVISFMAFSSTHAVIYDYPLEGVGDYIPALTNTYCDKNDLTMSMYNVTPTGIGSKVGDTSSTSCYGYVYEPDNTFGNDPSPNIGTLYDGLLNGQPDTWNNEGPDNPHNASQDSGYYIDPNLFLTNQYDSWVDPTNVGWIQLATGGSVGSTTVYSDVNGYNTDQFIDFYLNADGTWSLSVDPTAIVGASIALGRPAVFDHLTFVFKGPNTDNDWAIFDINFWDLITEQAWDISLGDTIYYFTGTYDQWLFDPDQTDGRDQYAISHWQVWAHDPPPGGDIPVPTPLALLGIGLLVSYIVRKIH